MTEEKVSDSAQIYSAVCVHVRVYTQTDSPNNHEARNFHLDLPVSFDLNEDIVDEIDL